MRPLCSVPPDEEREIVFRDADEAADPDGRDLAGVDQATDMLLRELKVLGNVSDGQEAWRTLSGREGFRHGLPP